MWLRVCEATIDNSKDRRNSLTYLSCIKYSSLSFVVTCANRRVALFLHTLCLLILDLQALKLQALENAT